MQLSKCLRSLIVLASVTALSTSAFAQSNEFQCYGFAQNKNGQPQAGPRGAIAKMTVASNGQTVKGQYFVGAKGVSIPINGTYTRRQKLELSSFGPQDSLALFTYARTYNENLPIDIGKCTGIICPPVYKRGTFNVYTFGSYVIYCDDANMPVEQTPSTSISCMTEATPGAKGQASAFFSGNETSAEMRGFVCSTGCVASTARYEGTPATLQSVQVSVPNSSETLTYLTTQTYQLDGKVIVSLTCSSAAFLPATMVCSISADASSGSSGSNTGGAKGTAGGASSPPIEPGSGSSGGKAPPPGV